MPDLPPVMQAVQITGPGVVACREFPVPAVSPREVLVKVEAVTTCPQWDLHMLAGEPMFPGGVLEYPLPVGQPGHEMAGEIVAVGSEVNTWRPGAKVVAWRDPGKVRLGCYAQYVPFDPANLLERPSPLTAAQTVSLELAMCVQVSMTQLQDLRALQDKRMVVSGLGPAGLIAVQMARLYGAGEILALDPLPARRRLAIRAGADQALDPHALGAIGRSSAPWDTGMDCTGLAASVAKLLELCGEVVHVFGVLRDSVAFGLREYRKGLALVGYGNHSQEAALQALQLLRAGQLDLSLLATHTLPLMEYRKGVELLRRHEAVKVCFLPGAQHGAAS